MQGIYCINGDFPADIALPEPVNNPIRIYPNPGCGTGTVLFGEVNSSEISQIVIYNLFGDKIQSSPVYSSSALFDISNHGSGIYFLQIYFEKEKYISARFIVE